MAFLQENDRKQITKMFDDLKGEVKLIFFTQEIECPYCNETEQILNEVADLSDKIKLDIYKLNSDESKRYGIDRVPATIVEGSRDFGIRYYGIPSGYEFSSLLEDIIDVSKGVPGLSESSIALLKQIKEPLNLKVFVTPTCPHCPKAVRLAHKIAIENEFVTAEMVEATEFPELSQKFNVRGVPRTIIGEKVPIEGSMPEQQFIERVIESVKHINQ